MWLYQNIFLLAAKGAGKWAHWPFGPGFEGSWLYAILKFVFIAVILALLLALLRWAFGPGGFMRDKDLDEEAKAEQESKQEALRILDERLAKGEISVEEYEQRKQALKR
mgnify:CR=1 FL=1